MWLQDQLNGPVLEIQFVEVLRDLDHGLSFGLRDKSYQKCCTQKRVRHKNQEAELTESILQRDT